MPVNLFARYTIGDAARRERCRVANMGTPNIDVNLGESIPFVWDKFLKLIGKDSESIELRQWFTDLQRVGFVDASNI